jgi:hypothetical protein
LQGKNGFYIGKKRNRVQRLKNDNLDGTNQNDSS